MKKIDEQDQFEGENVGLPGTAGEMDVVWTNTDENGGNGGNFRRFGKKTFDEEIKNNGSEGAGEN